MVNACDGKVSGYSIEEAFKELVRTIVCARGYVMFRCHAFNLLIQVIS